MAWSTSAWCPGSFSQRLTPEECGSNGFCTVRGFTCLTARATDELRFARCSKSRGNDELHKVIRFDFGS